MRLGDKGKSGVKSGSESIIWCFFRDYHTNRKLGDRNLVIKMEIADDKKTYLPLQTIIFLYDFITVLISF